MLCSCDYDSAFSHKKATAVAGLGVKCTECNEPLPWGQKYEYVEAMWEDGDQISEYHTCDGCASVQKAIGCFLYADIFDQLVNLACEEYDGDLPIKFLDGISPAGLAKLDKYVFPQIEERIEEEEDE